MKKALSDFDGAFFICSMFLTYNTIIYVVVDEISTVFVIFVFFPIKINW